MGGRGFQPRCYVPLLKQPTPFGHLMDTGVYHGLAGHFFVKDVPHALKVRALADMDDRVRFEMERKNIDAQEARDILEKDDEERRKWSQRLYGIDTADPSL